ncbi:hypothetical protein Tcan_12862 [Toxocara canis]|uniref:Uncharacterized protein n=1 Tax=Toxocara canis TaxID=6265 RepID=A0A0B2V891_TOXCA|nr:hypothetical protein Tcan_12862 [Toxocara canis]
MVEDNLCSDDDNTRRMDDGRKQQSRISLQSGRMELGFGNNLHDGNAQVEFECEEAGAEDDAIKNHRDEDEDNGGRELDADGVIENDEEAARNNAVGLQVHFEDLPDRVAKNVVDYDEVSWARRMRVVTAPEACYRNCGYLMHRLSHTIVRLNFHLPGEKNVYFVEGEEAQALHRAKKRRSQLEAFFELNRTDLAAREYTYLDIPKQYRWDEKGAWVRRVRKDKILTRMYTVKARFVEKFCLRMLSKYVEVHAVSKTSEPSPVTLMGPFLKRASRLGSPWQRPCGRSHCAMCRRTTCPGRHGNRSLR